MADDKTDVIKILRSHKWGRFTKWKWNPGMHRLWTCEKCGITLLKWRSGNELIYDNTVIRNGKRWCWTLWPIENTECKLKTMILALE